MSDLPVPSYAVDVAAEQALVDRVETVVRTAVGHARLAGRPVADLPDDYGTALRGGLAADAPLPQVVALDAASGFLDHTLLTALLGAPAVVSLQVLRGHGLIGAARPTAAWVTPEVGRVRTVLAASHHHHAGPSLIEAEALLAGLGIARLDPVALLAVACLIPSWGQEPPLGHDWPAHDLAPWVARHVDALIEIHDGPARPRTYDHTRFYALLASLDPLPERVAEWLFGRALGGTPAERPLARAVLSDHPDRHRRAADALGDRAAAVRTAAAAWLTVDPATDDRAVVEALEAAVRREKDDKALGVILAALVAHGRSAGAYLDRAALDAAAEKAAAKPLPASLAWLDPAALPPVSWADTGDLVPPSTVRSWVQRAVKAKSSEPDPLLQAVLSAVDAEGRTALADALLHQWLSVGAPTASRGILALVATGAGERTAAVAATFVRTRAKQQGTPAQALVALLARIDSPLAVQALVEAADSSGHAGVRKAAAAEVEGLAERRGLTVEQVGDRGAPTAGFDASGQLSLSFGERSFTAVLQPDLKVVVVAEGLATRSSLPAARASDDADLVAAARATLAAAKKTVVATGKTQTARLRQAMSVQRAWTVEDWYADIAGHPVLGRIATGLVWLCDGVAFRPLDDGTLTDADDAPVELLDPGASVTLAHDVLLDAEAVEAWRTHLADYEVAVPFTQLGDPLPPFDPEATGLTDVVGSRTSASALHRLAERAGFTRLVDGGVVAAYSKLLVGDVGATLEVRGDAWVGDWAAEVELGVLLVTSPAGPVRLDALPPVQLAELRRDLAGLAG